MMKNKKAVRIIVPLCIILIAAGIWIFKNMENDVPADETLPQHADYALDAESIDMEALTSHGLPIIIDFGSDSCAPCREFAPVLKAMNEEMQDLAIIKYIDVAKYGEVAADYPVQVIPTQIFFLADGTPYVPSEDITIAFTMYTYEEGGAHAFTVHQGGLTAEEMRTILTDMGVSQ